MPQPPQPRSLTNRRGTNRPRQKRTRGFGPDYVPGSFAELFGPREKEGKAIAMIGEIKDGPLIEGVWVGEIAGVVNIYFALMDDGTEEIEDYAERLVGVLAHLRERVDGDGLMLWDGVAPAVWRPATQAEYDSFDHPVEHLLCGWGLPTVPGMLCVN
jgi:hypothetical protein